MDTANIHPDYLKGFNEGYILKKHLPDVAEKLEKSIGQSQRADGFRSGRDQAEQEKNRDAYPAWLKKERIDLLNNNADHTKEKEIDWDGPER